MNFKEMLSTMAVFRKGVGASFRINNVSLKQLFGLPIVNMAAFFTFVYSVRGMLTGKGGALNPGGLEMGGLWWFTDLTLKDSTYILPLLAVGASYAAVEIGFKRVGAPDAQLAPGAKPLQTSTWLQDFFQTGILLFIPVIINFPAGVFCYWIPSSVVGVCACVYICVYISCVCTVCVSASPTPL